MDKGKFYSALNKTLLWIEGPLWDFVKKHWKLMIIAFLIAHLLINIQTIGFQKSEISNLKGKLFWSDSSTNSKLVVWKDRYNKEHTRAQNLALERGEMLEYVDSFAKLLKIKPKSITSVSKTGTVINTGGKLKVDTVYRDTSGAIVDHVKFKWPVTSDSNWIKVYGRIGGGKDSIKIEIRDTLTRVDYSKRKWILGKKIYYTDISHSNPYVKVEGYKGITLKPEKMKWSIGPTIGVGYIIGQPINIRQPQLQLGVSIQYSLFKF